jgi:hypothetical protein
VRSDEAELVGGDPAAADEPARHHRGPVAQPSAVRAAKAHLGVHLGEAAHRRPEVPEVDAAPVLAVGDGLQPDVFLETHCPPDVRVLLGPERFR